MTATVTTASAGPFAPDGVTTAFPFTFKAMTGAEVAVVRLASTGVQTPMAGYSVALNATGGGTVNFSLAPIAGDPIYIYSDPSFEQQIDFANQGSFSPTSVNTGFDRSAVRDIYMRSRLDRAFMAPLGETITNLPSAASRANTFLAFDGSGNPIGSTAVGAKGDPGSPGEGYATRTAMAARAAPAVKDDVYLTELGREGKFVVDLASNWTAAITADTAQGLFVASTADATKVYVRKFKGPLDIRWFGAVADNATDCYPAFAAALSLLAALGDAPTSTDLWAPALRVPAASNKYYVSQTVDFDLSATVLGDGSALNLASALRFPAGQTGFRAQSYNTSGASTTGASHTRSQGCIFRGLAFYGGYTNLASEGEFHAVHIKDRTFVEDCYFENWQGDCVYIFANAGNGNANGWNVRRCRGVTSRRMLYVEGSDTNAGKAEMLDSALMRASGIEDKSFIGANTYDTCQIAHCGEASNSGVLFGGNAYWVVAGQEAAATTNAPSGTTADNAWWYYISPASNHSAGVNAYPTWTGGMAQTRAIGAYYTHGSSITLMNCYSESAQVSQLGALTLVVQIHGHGAPLRGGFSYVDGGSSGYTAVGKFNATDISQFNSYAFFLGNTSWPGAAVNGGYVYRNSVDGLVAYGIGSTYDFRIFNNNGVAALSVLTGTPNVVFGGSITAGAIAGSTITGTGAIAGTSFKVSGNQVVGARGASLPADATDLATALALVNAIKARIKTTGGHGLVAD